MKKPQAETEEEFILRGLASGEEARRTGQYVGARQVLANLRRMLKAAQKEALQPEQATKAVKHNGPRENARSRR
jgi:hypothetical protein